MMKKLIALMLALCLVSCVTLSSVAEGTVWQSSGGFSVDLPEGCHTASGGGRLVVVSDGTASPFALWYENPSLEEPESIEDVNNMLQIFGPLQLVAMLLKMEFELKSVVIRNGLTYEIGWIAPDTEGDKQQCVAVTCNSEILLLICNGDTEPDGLINSVHYSEEARQQNAEAARQPLELATAHFSVQMTAPANLSVMPLSSGTSDALFSTAKSIPVQYVLAGLNSENMVLLSEWEQTGDYADFIIYSQIDASALQPCVCNGLNGVQYAYVADGVTTCYVIIPGESSTMVMVYASAGQGLASPEDILATLTYQP